jgi:mono/diheme cytochrome c family protein
MRLLQPWLAAALLTLAGVAQAQTSPQDELLVEGHELALTLCSVCHVAAADQTGTPVMSNPGPPFRDIANRPEITQAALRTFLRIAHASTFPPFTMPNPHLSDQQIDAMIAYILSMRGQQ